MRPVPDLPLRLITFRSVSLVRPDGGPVGKDVQRPRTLAVLALLAAAGARGLRRSELVEILWPNSHDRGSGNLAELERHLRASLRATLRRAEIEPFENFGDHQQRLSGEVLTSDVQDFRTALDEGRLGDAVSMRPEDFLASFSISHETEQFRSWVAGEQRELRMLLRRALGELARQLEAAGRWDAALPYRERAASVAGNDQSAIAAFVACLDRAGARHRALAELDRAEAILTKRRVPLSTSMLEVADYLRSPRVDPFPPLGPAARPPAEPAGFDIDISVQATPGRGAESSLPIAVLDFFDASPQESYGWLSPLLADSISHALSHQRGISVVSRDRALRGPAHRLDPESLSPAELRSTLVAAATELEAEVVVWGKYRVDRDRVEILPLLATPDGTVIGLDRSEQPLIPFDPVIWKVVGTVMTGTGRPHVPKLDSGAVSRVPSDLETLEAYGHGRAAFRQFTPVTLAQAEQDFSRAAERSPEFAPAHSGLGSVSIFRFIAHPDRALLERGILHLKRALSLDPSLVEPLLWLGYAYSRTHQYEEASRAALQAAALMPNDPESLYFAAGCLHTRALMEPHHTSQRLAARLYQEAIAADPYYAWAAQGLTHLYLLNGQYDAAQQSIERILTSERTQRVTYRRAPPAIGALAVQSCLLMRQRRIDTAEETLHMAIENYEHLHHLWALHFTILSHCMLARIHEIRGEYTRAITQYQVARNSVYNHRERLGMGYHAIRVHLGLAGAYSRVSGRRHSAVREEETALTLITNRSGFDFNWTWGGSWAETHLEVARHHALAGDTEKMRQAASRAIKWGWGDPELIRTDPAFQPAFMSGDLEDAMRAMSQREKLPET